VSAVPAKGVQEFPVDRIARIPGSTVVIQPGRAVGFACCGVVLSAVGGCGELFRNQTTSLGGNVAGGRGSVRVVFINNTAHRAVFTFGTYDQTDRASQPDFRQFGVTPSQTRLNAEETSAILSVDCGRVFSVGGPNLLGLIRDNIGEDGLIGEALVEGVDFYTVETDDDETTTRAGRAAPLEALLGVDFPCGGLIVIHFEVADVGAEPFRNDFNVIPSESGR